MINPFNDETSYVEELKNSKIFENHLHHIILVFIGKPSMSSLRWVPIYQGFGHFQFFHIIL